MGELPSFLFLSSPSPPAPLLGLYLDCYNLGCHIIAIINPRRLLSVTLYIRHHLPLPPPPPARGLLPRAALYPARVHCALTQRTAQRATTSPRCLPFFPPLSSPSPPPHSQIQELASGMRTESKGRDLRLRRSISRVWGGGGGGDAQNRPSSARNSPPPLPVPASCDPRPRGPL